MLAQNVFRSTIATLLVSSLAGCVIAVDRSPASTKEKAPSPPAAMMIGCPEGTQTVTKDESQTDGKHIRMIVCSKRVGEGPKVEATMLLPKLAELRVLLANDADLQGESRTRVLGAIDEQIARLAAKRAP
jgi:hypothetical protein